MKLAAKKIFIFVFIQLILMIFFMACSAYFQETVSWNPPPEFAQEFEAIRQEITNSRGKLIAPAAEKEHILWWIKTFSDYDLSKVLIKRALDPSKYDDPVYEHNINLAVSLVRWVLHEDKILENKILRANIAYKSESVQELVRVIRDYADF